MITLILALGLGLIFTFFATQNTTGVTIALGNLLWTGIPLYVVVLGTLLIGFLIASFLSLINEATSALTISGKDHQLKKNENIVEELKSKINQLELENTHLRGELKKANIDAVKEKVAHTKEGVRNFFGRMRHSISS